MGYRSVEDNRRENHCYKNTHTPVVHIYKLRGFPWVDQHGRRSQAEHTQTSHNTTSDTDRDRPCE